MKSVWPMFALCAIVNALGTPTLKRATVVERDLPTMSSAFDNIIVTTQNLDDMVSSFNSTIEEVGALYASAQVVQSALVNASETVRNTSPVTEDQAIVIANQTNTLAKLVNGTITTLIDKKPGIVRIKVGTIVFNAIAQLSNSSEVYTEIVISKLSGYAKGAAREFSDPISESFLIGLKAYQDQAETAAAGTAAVKAAQKAASGHISINLPLTAGGYALFALAAGVGAMVL